MTDQTIPAGPDETFNHAHFVINETYADEYVKQHMTPLKVTQALADAGCLASDPQIIRTVEELEALDPETVLMEVGNVPQSEAWTWIEPETGKVHPALGEYLPVVMVATGAQVRAARTALQEN